MKKLIGILVLITAVSANAATFESTRTLKNPRLRQAQKTFSAIVRDGSLSEPGTLDSFAVSYQWNEEEAEGDRVPAIKQMIHRNRHGAGDLTVRQLEPSRRLGERLVRSITDLMGIKGPFDGENIEVLVAQFTREMSDLVEQGGYDFYSSSDISNDRDCDNISVVDSSSHQIWTYSVCQEAD